MPVDEPHPVPAKAPTGISGLDVISAGGLPRDGVTLIAGGTGTGKTVFGLQYLAHGARESEPGIFVSFEEAPERLRAQARSFGWDPGEDEVLFHDARLDPDALTEGGFDIIALLASLDRLVERSGARRLVIDGIDNLLDALPGRTEVRRETHRLQAWLRARRLAVVLTGKPDETVSEFRDYDTFVEFLADCVIRLRQESTGSCYTRTLRIVKLRGSPHAGYECPFIISDDGIQVADLLAAGHEHEVSSDRLSTGVPGLDEMLGGGYYRGSSIILSGPPGTAKTTLAGAFAASCCEDGEPVLFVTFDESEQQIARNLRSVGLDLQPWIDEGLLHFHSTRSRGANPQEHVLGIHRLWQRHDARHVIVDPLSALETGMQDLGETMAQLLIDMARREGRTILTTSLVPDGAGLEKTDLGLSTGADTWIALSYVAQAGERNRALTIIKSRGMKHSNQVRELILGEDGPDLTDVYVAGGEVLMGTLRWEREAAERDELSRREARTREELLEARSAVAASRTRLEQLSRELDVQQQRVDRLERDAERARSRHEERRETIARLRGSDESDEEESGP